MADLSGIVDKIKQTIEGVRPKFPVFPALLMACSLAKRPGLSVNVSFAKTIGLLKKDGFKTGKGPDGQPNKTSKFVHNILKETFRALTEDAVVQVTLPFGSLTITGAGANAGGPVTTVGTNTTNTNCNGDIK